MSTTATLNPYRSIRYFFQICLVWACVNLGDPALALDRSHQQAILADDHTPAIESVSQSLFMSLERSARLVDIAYCVGNTGISPPFSCVSRCSEFPSLQLVTTWNTGMLMTDSCGYIAVDHGAKKTVPRSSPEDYEKDESLKDVYDGDGPAIVVAFRGTYSLTNTIIDLSTVPQEYVPYPPLDDGEGDGSPAGRCDNCTVHMGFLTSWRNARNAVLPALKSVREKHPTYPVHLIGHSLGGAVAALAALDIRLALRWDDVKVTTFGEPRVGNDALVSYIDRAFGMEEDDGYDPDLEKRVYQRVTHVNDPVPLLPPAEWGYRSHAGEIYVTKSNLPPARRDVHMCRGDHDGSCIAGAESFGEAVRGRDADERLLAEAQTHRAEETRLHGQAEDINGLPGGLKLWELFFAHRDYFWRLGLCVPGGDPIDWWRDGYNMSHTDSDA